MDMEAPGLMVESSIKMLGQDSFALAVSLQGWTI